MKTWHATAAVLSLLACAQAAHATVTTYKVVETFNQVVYDASNPTWDTVFTGSFSYDDVTQTVSGLNGSLSQAMSGNTTFRQLGHQLSSVYDSALGGLLVTAFFQDSTDVFAGGGFATGGKKAFGNQNAYATIFVNTANPMAALSDAQTDQLAYADCTTGGLMGMMAGAKTCMTGWVDRSAATLAGGTMRGTYPVTQAITAVPEPQSLALAMTGLCLLAGALVRRRAPQV